MTALCVCDGAVSSEHRSNKGSPAAALRTAGAASVSVAAEATKLRRDHNRVIAVLLLRVCCGLALSDTGKRAVSVRNHGARRLISVPDTMRTAFAATSNLRSTTA